MDEPRVIDVGRPAARKLRLTCLAVTCFAVGSVIMGQEDGFEEKTLMDFGDPGVEERWQIVNDDVMGGLSRSRIASTPNGTAIFEGRLSLENNGGFASVRTLVEDRDLSDYEGLALRVKGDGRAYQIRLRDGGRSDGVAWRADFPTTPDQWLTVRVRFSELRPTYRGRMLSGVAPLDLTNLRQIAFMIADEKTGAFRLEVEWIKVFKTLREPPGR